MPLSRKVTESLAERGFSRRQISRIAMGAAAAIPFFNEFALAQQAADQTAAAAGMARRGRGGMGGGARTFDPDVVRITSNENPMGPCKEGLEALMKVAPLGWRYSPQGENLSVSVAAGQHGERQAGYVTGYPGSSIPLANCASAFTSPTRSWVMGGPGYGSGASRVIGNKVVKVPLRKDYSHDVEAMIKADPNAGAYYICNPNNPTGTLRRARISSTSWRTRTKDAVLIIDEAYVAFLRAGEHVHGTGEARTKTLSCCARSRRSTAWPALRAGAAYGRPDLLEKVRAYGGSGMLPVTATACAAASMKVGPSLMKERLRSTSGIATSPSNTSKRPACGTFLRAPTSS